MRSLFLKVFLWFWLAMTVVVGALAGTYYLTRSARGPRPPQFIAGIMWAYSRNAVAFFERGGRAGLISFLEHAERDAGIHAYLLDARGVELTGREVVPEVKGMADLAFRTGRLETRKIGNVIYEANAPPEVDGDRYAFVAAFPFGPEGPAGPPAQSKPPGPLNFLFSDTPAALLWRVVAVILTAGVLCYLLARYIVAPVVKLRAVTRQVSGGNLSARVGPLLGRRRDELADLGRDFDAMAAQIEMLMRAQQQLLRDISHELRSPLTRLGVALHQARKRAGAEAASHLTRIEREAGRINEMIAQLLSLARWETGADDAQRAPIDLCALVREVSDDADFEARGQNRAVQMTECAACEVSGTPSLLRSAVENVVRNAVRHTPEGTSVSVSLRREKSDGGEQAVLSVRDEGAGVPEEALGDIFRPFYRIDDSRARETGGAGLGLTITERAVRLHGGSVTAANIPDGGFVIEIRLPLTE